MRPVDAKLRSMSMHVFGHTFASHCIMRGVSPKEVSDWMGHSGVEIINRYMHLAPKFSKSAALLDGPVPGLPGAREHLTHTHVCLSFAGSAATSGAPTRVGGNHPPPRIAGSRKPCTQAVRRRLLAAAS